MPELQTRRQNKTPNTTVSTVPSLATVCLSTPHRRNATDAPAGTPGPAKLNVSTLPPDEPFRAASLPRHFQEWCKITSDPVILDYVLNGVDIDFLEWPKQKTRPVTVMNQNQACHMDMQVSKLVSQGVLIISGPEKDVLIISGPEKGDFYSRVFLREKKDGKSFRMIINLKCVKEKIAYQHFKMSSVERCVSMLQEGAFMASLDLQDAYFSVMVKPLPQMSQIHMAKHSLSICRMAPRARMCASTIHKNHETGHVFLTGKGHKCMQLFR